jgi:hypothetical protein
MSRRKTVSKNKLFTEGVNKMKMNLADAQRAIVCLPKGDSSHSLRFASLGIPTSKKLTGLEVRLSQVLIIDNKTPHVWPFIRYSNLYVVTSSVDNLGTEPYSLNLKGFADVDDGEQLPVDRTLYYWKEDETKSKPPGAIHVLASIIKSNEGIRDVGAALASLRKSDDFKTVIKAVIAAATGGGAAIYEAFLPLIGVIGEVLGKIDDTPLFTTVLSYTDINGDFDQLGRHPYPQRNRYVDMVTTLIVRDATRDPSLTTARIV